MKNISLLLPLAKAIQLSSWEDAILSQDLDQEVNYPGDFCCTLFEDPYLRGAQLTLCHDGDGTTKSFDLAGEFMDKRMSSYYCGKNVAYDFCGAEGTDCYITGAGYHKMIDL